MIGIVLPKADDKLLSALILQKCKDFKVYVPGEEIAEPSLQIVHGSWSQVAEPLVAILEPGAMPGPDYVKRILHTASRHEEFPVYHMNVEGAKAFPRKTAAKKLFKLSLIEGAPVPLSSLIFRTDVLRSKAVFKADGSLDALSSALSCMGSSPLRAVWKGVIGWTEPAAPGDPIAQERAIREKLDVFRFTESFFGDNDYPLSVGDQMALFAGEIAKLYPSYSEEDLKEIMAGFEVSSGPVRKMRAHSALKKAIKERQNQLK